MDDGEAVYVLSEEQKQQIQSLQVNQCNANNSETNKRRKTSSEKSIDAVREKLDTEEHLILEVQSRPPLWNFTLPLQERSKLIKNKLWIEVSNELKGSFTPDGAQKKFKNLVDTFRNIIRNEKCPSGAARPNNCGSKWSHYHNMHFLRDYLTPKQTISNCVDNEDSSSLNDSMDDTNSFSSNSKRSRNSHRPSESEMLCNSFNKVAEAINASSSSNQIVLPSLPEMTEIDACLGVVGSRLKKIPEIYQSEATQEILNFSLEVLKKYNS